MRTHTHTHVCACTYTHACAHAHTHVPVEKNQKLKSGNVVLSTLAGNCTCLSTSRQEAPGSCPLNVHVIKTNCVHNLLNWYNWYTWTINWYAVDVFWAWQVHDSTWYWTSTKGYTFVTTQTEAVPNKQIKHRTQNVKNCLWQKVNCTIWVTLCICYVHIFWWANGCKIPTKQQTEVKEKQGTAIFANINEKTKNA